MGSLQLWRQGLTSTEAEGVAEATSTAAEVEAEVVATTASAAAEVPRPQQG